MSKVQLQSGNHKVISSGTAFTFNGEDLSISILDHSTEKHPRIEVFIFFKFYEHASGMPLFEREDVFPKEHQNHFSSVCTIKVSVEDKYVITEERVYCAEYPGGNMYITFQAFALPKSKQKGLHYTIYEIAED